MAVVVRLAGSTGVLHSRCSRGRTCSRRKWILVRHHRRCHPQDTRTCFGRLRAGHEMGWAARAAWEGQVVMVVVRLASTAPILVS
eukprot:2324753-Prymnesium_polylepis.3